MGAAEVYERIVAGLEEKHDIWIRQAAMEGLDKAVKDGYGKDRDYRRDCAVDAAKNYMFENAEFELVKATAIPKEERMRDLVQTREDGTQYLLAPILVRTRTGKKIHAGSLGSSVTNCGVWMKTNGGNMEFRKDAVIKALERGAEIANYSGLGPRNLVLCEKCFANEAARTVEHIDEWYVTVAQAREAWAAVEAHNKALKGEV